MNLNFAINFDDLNSLEGLKKIDQIFLEYLVSRNQILHDALIKHRLQHNPANLSPFLIELAAYVDDFIAELFFIESENLDLKTVQRRFDIIYECRRKFVQRVFKDYQSTPLEEINFPDISKSLVKIIGQFTETIFAENVVNWLKKPEEFSAELKLAADYACYMVAHNSSLPLFNIPRSINADNLIRNHRIQLLAEDADLGFDYRDKELKLENALAHSKYCIYCHNQQKDSCRYGALDKKESLENHIDSSGCPLDQKISEMNKLMAEGFSIGALGVIIIDNPLVAATGHRICNDCMKSCIFQKQDPVNIPLIESVILDNVLKLPYGVEIYLLLTKWNPLNIESPLPNDFTNYTVLVVGTGPAGFALSHYLLNEGHNVVAIDGLKIEPLDFDITKPIKDYHSIKVPLSERVPKGFGGVAEYGITNRWDKNNLTLIRLILERRIINFKMIGGVRLGSNITTDQAFDIGFDYVALCTGAGKPRYINSASYFLKGVKSAADFLMNLQQVGSYLKRSNNNLLLRMPVVVIGCGLTAIDSAVEAMNYYPVQVEKFLSLYEQNPVNLDSLPEEERVIAQEFISHAKLFRKSKSSQDKIAIMQQLGGVTVCYRGKIKDSPAYKRNHEEIEHAKAARVNFLENLSPLEVIADEYHYACGIKFTDSNKKVSTLPAKSVLVAIGTLSANVINGDKISRFGDCDPQYSGSVVKALASSKKGYKKISNELLKYPPKLNINFQTFSKSLDDTLKAKVYEIHSISPRVIKLVIESRLSTKNYSPGQIFRLQNFANHQNEFMKPIPLNPYQVDKEKGLIYFMIKQVGNSTKLCAKLKTGEDISLMGPTGAATNIPKISTVTLIGYDIRNLALLPIAKKFKQQGSNVIFLAVYKKMSDKIYAGEIEALADKVIWVTEDELFEVLSESKLAEENKSKYYIAYVSAQLLIKLKEYFQNLPFDNHIICNLPSPMQCMMQGICGQCIQKTTDSNGYIFACGCSEYTLEHFDPQYSLGRLKQNSLLEEIGRLYFDENSCNNN